MTTKLYFETDQGLKDIEITPVIISSTEDDGIDEMGGLPIDVTQQLDQA